MATTPAPTVQTSGNLQYIGNPDFRGFLAANNPALLDLVGQGSSGNDTTSFGYNPTKVDAFAKANNTNSTDVAQMLQGLFDTFQTNSANTGASTTTGGSTTTNDPNAVAYYSSLADQLSNQLGGIDNQQQNGLNNIGTNYSSAVDKTTNNEQNALTGYNTNLANNLVSRESNVGNINMNAANGYNALEALLARSGGAGSSAGEYTIPQAVSNNALSKRTGADTTFNSNNASINNGIASTKQDYQNALVDLLNQKNTNTQNFLQGLDTTKGNLTQQIANAKFNAAEYGGKGYAGATNASATDTAASANIQDQINQLMSQYTTTPYNAPTATAHTPNIASYGFDPSTVGGNLSGSGSGTTTANPYLLQAQNPTSNLLAGGGQ